MKRLISIITSLFCMTVITYSQADSIVVKVPFGSASGMATTSTLVSRDADANITANNWLGGYTTTATAAGTTTLTVASAYLQYFTGSTTQNCKLPVVSTLALGTQYIIVNNSTGAVTVQSSGSNTIVVLAAGTSTVVTSIATTGTDATVWSQSYSGVSVASGKKTTHNNSITYTGTDGTTMTLPGASQTLASLVGTETFTNKRVTKRAPTVTQSATPTINTDVTDVAHITGLAQAITSMTTNLSGTPVEGDILRIDITDNGTARAITWGASFEASTVPLPTTTVISTRLDCIFVWNSVTSKWRIVGCQ